MRCPNLPPRLVFGSVMVMLLTSLLYFHRLHFCAFTSRPKFLAPVDPGIPLKAPLWDVHHSLYFRGVDDVSAR